MKKLVFSLAIMMALSACGSRHLSWKQSAQSSQMTVPTQVKMVANHANSATAKLKKDKKYQGIIAYFNASGDVHEQAQEGGYYRQFLGRNPAGLAVVQDFYQDSKTPQTNPIVISDDKNLKNFDSAVAQGRVIWYSPKGVISEFLDYHNGLVQRGGYYNDTGALVLETEGDNSKDANALVKVRGFYENGKLFFENTQQKDVSESIFYYDNGQKMWHGVSNSETIHAWTVDGKPVDLTEIADAVSQAEKRANALMQKLH